jgi:hypothetical protein
VPSSAFLVSGITDHIHRCPIRPEPVRDDYLWQSIPLHRTLQKLESSLATPAFRDEYLKHFAFVINRPPEVMSLAVDPHKHLVQVPAPVRIPLTMNPPLPNLRRKHRAEPVPPEPYRLVADVDAAFEQQIFDLAQ